MAIKVNARETELKIGKKPGYYYVMTPDLYIALAQKKVIKEAALRSGVSQGVMQACWDAAGEVIKAWATEGHSVALPGLGTMRFAVRSKAVADVNDVKTGLIKSRRIVFTPSVDLKEELANQTIPTTTVRVTTLALRLVTTPTKVVARTRTQAPMMVTTLAAVVAPATVGKRDKQSGRALRGSPTPL